MIPRFSIIIPAFNEEFELPQTLRAFECAIRNYQTGSCKSEFEFLVVDNASTDATARIAEEWGARVVAEPFRQIARARNTGARAARGEIIVTCDADSRPHPQIFNRIDHAFAQGVFAGGVRIWASPLKWSQLPIFLTVNIVSLIARLPAGMVFLRRTDFLAIGGYDETLYALEDANLARRLRRLARSRGQGIAILWNSPILTSTRKFRRSRMRDWFRMGLLSVLRPGKYLRERDHWEDLYYSPHLRDPA